jgi:hypothetical protein
MECIDGCEELTTKDGTFWCKYYESWLDNNFNEIRGTFSVYRCNECENNSKKKEHKPSSKELMKQVDIISEAFVDFQDVFAKAIRDLYYRVREI